MRRACLAPGAGAAEDPDLSGPVPGGAVPDPDGPAERKAGFRTESMARATWAGRSRPLPPILPNHRSDARGALQANPACGLVPGRPIFLRSPVVAKLRSARACGCAGRHTQRGGPAVARRASEIRRRPLSPPFPSRPEVVSLGALSTRARGPGSGPGRRVRPFRPGLLSAPAWWAGEPAYDVRTCLTALPLPMAPRFR